MAKRGNAHTTQITYPTNTSNYLPEPELDQYEDYGEDTPTEYGSEGSTVYVGNLPYHIDDESLTLSFDHAVVVVFSKLLEMFVSYAKGRLWKPYSLGFVD
ncbi:28 kDa ribonucleoprotein, chloroplastic [Hordeum vulgare]|nr:28 kDa ribonucleoprotein, chloroplastic [Hordeum vulgare]